MCYPYSYHTQSFQSHCNPIPSRPLCTSMHKHVTNVKQTLSRHAQNAKIPRQSLNRVSGLTVNRGGHVRFLRAAHDAAQINPAQWAGVRPPLLRDALQCQLYRKKTEYPAGRPAQGPASQIFKPAPCFSFLQSFQSVSHVCLAALWWE